MYHSKVDITDLNFEMGFRKKGATKGVLDTYRTTINYAMHLLKTDRFSYSLVVFPLSS